MTGFLADSEVKNVGMFGKALLSAELLTAGKVCSI
jgi:hypothetical protein